MLCFYYWRYCVWYDHLVSTHFRSKESSSLNIKTSNAGNGLAILHFWSKDRRISLESYHQQHHHYLKWVSNSFRTCAGKENTIKQKSDTPDWSWSCYRTHWHSSNVKKRVIIIPIPIRMHVQSCSSRLIFDALQSVSIAVQRRQQTCWINRWMYTQHTAHTYEIKLKFHMLSADI